MIIGAAYLRGGCVRQYHLNAAAVLAGSRPSVTIGDGNEGQSVGRETKIAEKRRQLSYA